MLPTTCGILPSQRSILLYSISSGVMDFASISFACFCAFASWSTTGRAVGQDKQDFGIFVDARLVVEVEVGENAWRDVDGLHAALQAFSFVKSMRASGTEPSSMALVAMYTSVARTAISSSPSVKRSVKVARVWPR